jgi:hypothetical protein
MRTVGDSHGEDAGQTDAEVGGSSCSEGRLRVGSGRRRRCAAGGRSGGGEAIQPQKRSGKELWSPAAGAGRGWVPARGAGDGGGTLVASPILNPDLSLSPWRKEGSCGFSQLGSAKIHSFWATYTAVRRRRLR